MPGRRLNDTERRLLRKWENGSGLAPETLKSISINGNPGLRGIRSLELEFRYPLTVVCGRNGSGKTTALAVGALGFHTIDEHFPRGARLSSNASRDSAYLTFSDFFYKGPNDPNIAGVNITWEYLGRDSISITKRSEKWMHYERRPARAVHYLGISRTLPAIEQNVLRHHFNPRRRLGTETSLNADYMRRFGDIMGRSYSSASELASSNYRLRTCATFSPYSSFNMGAGEDILIDLLTVLQNTPAHSLVVIEEIELGLHPAALTSFAKHLQEIMLEKNLQVIVSTHSREFLDAVPSQARVLLQAGTDSHGVIYAPTTHFAMGTLSGRSEPELFIYCEDDVASEMIGRSLSANQRQRVKILPIGDKAEVARQAMFHVRTGLHQSHLVLWDGDVTDTEVSGWLNGFSNSNTALIERICFSFLHSTEAPEIQVVTILNTDNGKQEFMKGFSFENVAQADSLLSELLASNEPHDIPYKVSQQLNITEKDALQTLIDCARRTRSDDFDRIREMVNSVLEGKQLRGRHVPE